MEGQGEVCFLAKNSHYFEFLLLKMTVSWSQETQLLLKDIFKKASVIKAVNVCVEAVKVLPNVTTKETCYQTLLLLKSSNKKEQSFFIVKCRKIAPYKAWFEQNCYIFLQIQ